MKIKMYPEELREKKLQELLLQIKSAGKGKEFDCLIGVSGGIDSTYLAYLVKKWNLRPLAFHLDNGWNSELAVKNIEKVLFDLDIEFQTHVIDWGEFQDLQKSYFKASVLDIEVLTDHAIMGGMYATAAENKISFILTGINRATEQVLPRNWKFNKNDIKNIQDIHRRFGKIPLKTYPLLGPAKLKYYRKVHNIKTEAPLNLVKYIKAEAKATLETNIGWCDYGSKHGESVFTRFYQGYILPTKFNIDKRKAHLSSLICSHQISKNDALEQLRLPVYSDEELESTIEYVIKKLGFGRKYFENYMASPGNSHFAFSTDFNSVFEYKIFPKFEKLWRKIQPLMKKH